MKAESLTRSRAIYLINDSIDSFTFSHACYCTSNMESLTEEDKELYEQMHEVITILHEDKDYKHDLEIMHPRDLKEFLLMCKKMADNNNLSLKSDFPQGNFEIVEEENQKILQDEVTSEDTIQHISNSVSNKLNGETDLFTLLVNEVSQEIGEVIHIDEGMRITFRLDALDKTASYKTDWESKKEGGAEGTSFYSLVSLIKNTADDDSMDREMTFEEIGDYKVSAKVYKVMKQSLFSSLKELVQDYEFKVVVDESDDLYATMDFFDKLLKALQNVSWKEVAATSAEEVLKTLPMIVGTIIAVSAVLIALSMTPIGLLVSMLTPVVGAVMQAYAGANVIKDIAAGLYLFTDAVIQTKEAKSKGAMEQTSALFTKAFEYVGPNLLMDILMFFGGKAMKNVKGANKIEPVKEKQIFGKLNDNIEKSLNIELKIDKDDLTTVRTRLGVPKTETVAVGKTNVKGLEKITFEGQSPKVRKEAGLPDLDEVWRNRNIKAPGQNPLFTRHAEEVLANSFDKAVIEAKIKPEDVRGVLKIHQSNPSGVCRKCIQGLDNDIVKPGVLKQLSLKYPNLRIEVTSEVLPNVKVSGKSNFVIMNGKYIQ